MTTTATPAPRAADLARRTVTGLVLAVVVLGSIVTVPSFTLVVLGITLASLWELSRLSARHGAGMTFGVAAVAVCTYIVVAALGLQHLYEKPLIGTTIIASLIFSLAGERSGFFARSAFTVFGVLYIGWLGSYFIALRNLPHGAGFTAAAIVTIAFTDIFAMLIGTALGRTPLTDISPRKTWEGAIGGFVASAMAGAFLSLVPGLDVTWWDGAFIGGFTSIAAQAGDIVESALKRDARVKDAGTFFAGHGGVLDRFDSYTFGGIAFYFALFVTHHTPR